MKRSKLLCAALVLLMGMTAFYACETELQQPLEQSLNAEILTRAAAPDAYCGTPLSTALLIEDETMVGKIAIGNDAENLYVTYLVTEEYPLDRIYLYVGNDYEVPINPSGQPTYGQFPYNVKFQERVTEYTQVIPLDEIPPCVVIATIAKVKGSSMDEAWPLVDEQRSIILEYCIQVCDEEDSEDEVCYGDNETAWVDGPGYNDGGKEKGKGKGNWATYTPYGEDRFIPIYAGKTILVGRAQFSEITDGKVTITIKLDGWALQNVKESVKIQGYENAPSGNPAPGQFDTYKGKELIVTVPAYDFYGIHLDVREIIPCEEEIELLTE